MTISTQQNKLKNKNETNKHSSYCRTSSDGRLRQSENAPEGVA
jgi:hypothetical protein